jgi:hypothetical protein
VPFQGGCIGSGEVCRGAAGGPQRQWRVGRRGSGEGACRGSGEGPAEAAARGPAEAGRSFVGVCLFFSPNLGYSDYPSPGYHRSFSLVIKVHLSIELLRLFYIKYVV